MSKPQAWYWEDGSIGVTGVETVPDALKTMLDSHLDRDVVEVLTRQEPLVYAVPGAYFRCDAPDAWNMDYVKILKSVTDRPGRGYKKVLWWTA